MSSLTPEEQEEERNHARERSRKWWHEHKDMATARRRVKVTCNICGISSSRESVLSHQRNEHKTQVEQG